MKSIFNINADLAGLFTSLLCAVHCSAIPIFISLGLIGSGSWLHNHLFDWVIIGIGVVIAIYSLVGDYLRFHRNLAPLFIASLGFVFLFVGMVEHHGWILIFSVVGGLLVASAHYLNHKLGRTCFAKS